MNMFIVAHLLTHSAHSIYKINCQRELWTIQTLANSALVISDPKNSTLVNSDFEHWSIRTSTIGRFGPIFIGQFGPEKRKSLVSSDLFYWSIQTVSLRQFGPRFPGVRIDQVRIVHSQGPNQVRICQGPNCPLTFRDLAWSPRFVPDVHNYYHYNTCLISAC